jgi:hypothetical protein
MARSEPDISIASSRKTPEQRHGGLGTAFLDALDVVGGHAGTLRDFSDVEAQDHPAIIDRLAEGQCLTDRDSFWILKRGIGSHPAGVGTSHHTCLS